MGFFDQIKQSTAEASSNSKTITFDDIPVNAESLTAMLSSMGNTEFTVAALSVVALCIYESNPQESINMLNVLKGPQPLSAYDISFIKDRLSGKAYKPRSFFEGARPENNYKPSEPYSITVTANPHSYEDDGYATLYLKSGGADSERPVKLRKKPATGQWFLWEIMYLSDIRVPAAENPWA